MILIIDNYDSFTYNLYQVAGSIMTADASASIDAAAITVAYNDKITIAEIENLKPSHIIISPGPGRPKDAGICEDVIRHFAGKVPILGICLGHQAICEVFGATITYAKALVHGKRSMMRIDNGCPVFKGLPPTIAAGRYHSLAADKNTLPPELMITAETDDGEIMGVRHRDYTVYGLQFHPESILTPDGAKMIENFLKIAVKW